MTAELEDMKTELPTPMQDAMAGNLKLLPCPFCGSTKHTVLLPTCTRSTPYNSNDRAFPIVRCGGCYLDLPGDDWDQSGNTAVNRWNTRTPPAQEKQHEGS